jgi:hypothetical protein
MTRTEFEQGAWFPALQNALVLDGGAHTMDDVWSMIENGDCQFWPGVRSGIVTSIVSFPSTSHLHFFLAGGDLAELEAMTPTVLEWGKTQGCSKASLIGRRGWERTFLKRAGWVVQPLVHMEVGL